MIPHSGHALSHLYAEFVRYPTPQTAEYLVVVTAAQVLAALSCDCGGHKREGKEHTPSCRALQWAKERNARVVANPEVHPPLPTVPDRTVLGTLDGTCPFKSSENPISCFC